MKGFKSAAMTVGRLLLLLCLFSTTLTQKTERIIKKVAKFKCTFILTFSNTTVDMKSSSVKCFPKRPKKKNVNVILVSKGYKFNAKININPTKIQSIGVIPPASVIPDMFLSEYENITTDIGEIPHYSHCGGYGGNINGQEERNSPHYNELRAYTKTNVELWKNAEVSWAFVSNGDDYKTYGFYTDANVGVSKMDVKMTMKAMKTIQEKTGCIKFKRSQNPDKNKPWILLMRESKCTGDRCTCQKAYLRANLNDKEIGNFGKPFNDPWWGWSGNCFGGAFFDGLGVAKPRKMVISSANIEDNAFDLGLLVHEILHGLGLGHTQKRPDRDDHITIMWNDIEKANHGQFKKCDGPECITHGVPYDCNSIMHYNDRGFAMGSNPTMVARDANKCDIKTYKYLLADSDATLLKKMYCDGNTGTKTNLVISPNFPNNYGNSVDKEYKVDADAGNVIELWFTDFDIEDHGTCGYDWVQIVDADGTELLKKSCGKTKPPKITSKTKSLTVKFHSDYSENRRGFRAEWKQIKKTVPVDGGWSNWEGWSSCSNNRAGKGSCIKVQSRYCNNPAKSNGGKDCEGESTKSAVCESFELIDEKQHLDCVIQGGWSAWGSASYCNRECEAIRTRSCTNPKPFNDKTCSGSSSKTEACTGGDCSSSESGQIMSPMFPQKYPDDKDEQWALKVAVGSKIELRFTDFDIENHASCGYDYVQVLDSDNTEIMKKCGSSIPGVITSKSNTMTVKFHSDDSVSEKGFKATWKKVEASESGMIKSPNYPLSYSVNQDKTYAISVAPGSKIELTFTDFNIEYATSCKYDWVRVVDTDGEFIGQKLCGSTKPQPMKSKGNTMKVKFHSDESENFKGFSAMWKKVAN